jgi:hypothetical protein
VASYDASINVRVTGTGMVDGVLNRIQELERLVRDINTRPLNVNRIAGRGELADRFGAATRELNSLKNSFINSEVAVRAFGTTSNRTIANTTALASAFKRVADNSDVATAQFQEFTVAAQQAAVAANSLGRERLTVLANELSFGGAQGRTVGGGTLVQELIAQRNQIPNSVAALEAYQSELLDLQRIVRRTSPEFRQLEDAIRGVEISLGRGGQLGPEPPPVQGPALPPNGIPFRRPAPAAPTGLRAPGVADALIGGSFPLLFGGGPGAAVGGAVGGFIGGTMGGSLGMALSIAASAVGQKLDQIFGEAIRATQEVGKALSSLDATKLRETTIFVTAEFENQNRLLLEAGKYEQARAMATKEVAAQTGALGSSTADAADASNLLKKAFDSMMSPVNSLLANISGPFVAALAGALNIVGLIAKGLNVVVSGVGQLIKGITEWAIKLVGGQKALDRVRELTKATSEETEALRAAAEAEIDAGVRNVQLKKQLLDIERARLEGTNRIARASQIEADFRSKAVQIQADKENEIRQIYAEGSRLTAQQLNLKIQTAEATAAQKLQEAGITAEKARRKLLDNEAIAKLQAQQTIQENQSQSAQTLYSTESRRLQIATARLEAEKEFALSLNQQVGIVNKISELRKGQAQVEYQAAVASLQASVQQAANELTITETKYRQNEADVEQVHSARAKLATAQLHAAAEGMIADLQLEQNNYLIEIQRRQAVVNAYAESYARSTADATRNIEQQVNALNNRASLLNAISQATQTINNIEIQSLERELERNVATDRRAAIIERIYDLEVQNAKVVLEATRANIRAELARADAAYNTVLLKYKELEAVVNIARAQGVVNNAHYEALASQRSALRIAADNLNTAKQIGDVQWKAADAVYKAAVNAAKLRSEMLSATSAAQAFGDASVRAASAWSVFSKQTDPTKAGYYAERVNEQGRKETVRTFTVGTNPEPEMTYLPGARNAAGAGSESGYAGPINITTGPVMQQDSQRYVSLGDLESAMQQVVNTMMGNNRSAGGRRYAGIR